MEIVTKCVIYLIFHLNQLSGADISIDNNY